MNKSRLLKLAALALGGLYLAACVPDPTGAPCANDTNCPSNQHCDLATLKCVSGAGGSGGGAGGGGGSGGSGGGTGGGSGGGGGGSGCLNSQGNPADLQTDPQNCGTCGTACATPAHATATCVAARCGRSVCDATFYDIDGATTFGCEATCNGRTCTTPGGTVNLSNDPIHEARLVGRSVVNGSSVGANVQTNTSYSNMGSIGEATPKVGAGGGIETENTTHKHRGGFGARTK